ncbi:MAG TPA: DNA primase [Thiobacillaceae bacterium]|nr:DNA primase [Thiobacillaceae bacterium]HNU64092.1 DNA primase [Thiobacillaceae bacterium]
MARIPEDFIQQVLDRTDIVAVIDRYVPLRKAGINYQARCPFHGEKTPSFTVSPTKQFYHCFGCGAHGTAISFLVRHAGYEFIDAVKELASHAGLRVPDMGHQGVEDGRRSRILAHLDAAHRHYRQALRVCVPVVEYLKGRGLTGETAARFGLGYAADDWQGLQAVVGDYQDPGLQEAGLVIVQEGRRYDRFRNRITFPIRNTRGQVIGFGGRIIGQGEPKYLNSPETPVFHKGRELYGLYEHRRAIQQTGRVIVVEGYMDAVMLDQHGVDNAVATLGTALTAEQATQLLRLSDEVIFAFDGDSAGRKAAWRALENCLPQTQDGKRLAFLFLPDGEDPDSYVRNRGAGAFLHLCDTAKPLSDYLFDTLVQQTDMDSGEGRVRLATLVQPYLDKLGQAPLLARILGQRLETLTGLAFAARQRPAHRPIQTPEHKAASARGHGQIRISPWRLLLQALLHDTRRAARLRDLPEQGGVEARALGAVLALVREHPEYVARDVVNHFQARPEQTILEAAAADLLLWDADYDVEADFLGALAAVQRQGVKVALDRLSGKRPSDLSEEEKAHLLASLKNRKPGLP